MLGVFENVFQLQAFLNSSKRTAGIEWLQTLNLKYSIKVFGFYILFALREKLCALKETNAYVTS